MVILENIDIDKAILQNIDIDKISNRFKFGISNRAIREAPKKSFFEEIFRRQGRSRIADLWYIRESTLLPGVPSIHFDEKWDICDQRDYLSISVRYFWPIVSSNLTNSVLVWKSREAADKTCAIYGQDLSFLKSCELWRGSSLQVKLLNTFL